MNVSSTDVVAYTSLLLSVSSLTWQVYLGRRDRAVLSIRANVSDVMPAEPGSPSLGAVVFVSVSNRGRRPITISAASWSGRDKWNHMLIPSQAKLRKLDPARQQFWANSFPKLPLTLAESAAMSFYWPIETFASSPPHNVLLHDSHNVVHKLSWRAARKLRKAVERRVAKAKTE